MVNTQFFQFAKRKNSTARPGGTPGAAFNCNIKESSSVLRPTLQISTAGISGGGTGFPTYFNYAYIATFSRYYYVTEWVSIANELWEVSLEVDVLATYRVEIGNATAYVARASEDYDGMILDGMYPAKANSTKAEYLWPSTGHPWNSTGCYVLGLINSAYANYGCVSYYVFSQDMFADLKEYLLGDYEWTGIEDSNPDLGENLYKSLFNPFQYISSAMWLPVNMNSILGTGIGSISFGWWTLTNVGAYTLAAPQYGYSTTLSVGKHPKASTRGDYLCASPFTTYRLFAPPFGEFTLDGNLIASSFGNASTATINIDMTVDLQTGNGTLIVSCSAGTLLRTETRIGVDVQIAQVNSNGWGQVRNVAEQGTSVIASLFTGNIAGAISGAVTGILNGIENNVPHAQTMGSNGSRAQYTSVETFKLEAIWKDVVDDALSDKGRPLCKEVLLSTLAGGYIQTVGAHVDIAGFADEITQINDMLDAGIYLILPAG